MTAETLGALRAFDAPGTLLVTDRSSRVVFSNRSVEERTGFALAEVIGKRPGDLWGGRMEPPFYRKMWRRIDAERKPFVSRVDNSRKDGRRHTEVLHIAPLLDEGGEPALFVEIHPTFDSAEAERDFVVAFVRAFDPVQGTPALQAELLNRWLFRRAVVDDARSRGEFLDNIESRFISTMREAYRRRETDRALVAKAQADPDAFRVLYDAYYADVHRYLRARLRGDETAADDLAQETFLRAYRALPRFRATNASYLTYLVRIAHNLLVNHYRASALVPAPEEELDEVAVQEALPRFDIQRGLERLSDLERTVLLRFYRDGYLSREIAAELGRSENAVKLLLSRARKKLRATI